METHHTTGIYILNAVPLSQGKPIEWKPLIFWDTCTDFFVVPLSQGKPIEWKLNLKLKKNLKQ